MKATFIHSVIHDTDNLIIRDNPVSSTIIELSDNSLAIVDTGIPNNLSFCETISKLGYSLKDFTLVLNTHLHTDHAGGNKLFPNARILMSHRELLYERHFARNLLESNDPISFLRSEGRVIDNVSDLVIRDIKQLAHDYPIDSFVGDKEQREYYEDDPELPLSLSIMMAPGHTIDSRVVLLQGKTRRIAMTGDALYHRDLWKKDPMIAFHFNHVLFRRSVRDIAILPDIIIPGHDRLFDNLTQKYLPDNYLTL